MNIALVVSPYVDQDLEMACKESIGVCYLAAVLRRHGFTVTILDADLLRLDATETAAWICSASYDIVGFSVLEGTIESLDEIIRILQQKELSAHIVLGGYFPTMMVREVLQRIERVDCIILGEAEYSLLNLAVALRDKQDWHKVKGIAYRKRTEIIVNPCDQVKPVDELPFPDRDLLPEVLRRGGVTGIVGSRGCFASCSFCCINSFSKKSGISGWRGRSPVNIGDELELLVGKWGVRSISFYDGNFIGPGKAGIDRAYRIGEEIIKRNLDIHFAISTRADQVDADLFSFLKKAGLSEVFIGLESMTQRILDLYEKNITVEINKKAVRTLEECKVYFRPGFILYEPHITMKEIKENVDFLAEMVEMKYCNKFFFFKAVRIYRGSVLEKKFDKEGILIKNNWHVVYEWMDPMVGEFIRITGSICSQVVPLVQIIQSFDSEMKRYFETLLGKWNIQVHRSVLRLMENGSLSSDVFMDLSVKASDELRGIKSKVQRYIDSS